MELVGPLVEWQTHPVFLPGKSEGWRSLVGYSPWSRKESDTTEQLHFHFHSIKKIKTIIYRMDRQGPIV